MTTFTSISNTSLAQDKPLTQSIARALRDNPIAVAEGDPTAPRVATKAVNSQYIRVSHVAGQSAGVGNTVVKYDTKLYDPDGLYDPSTGIFQPTVPGVYLVGVKIITGNAPAGTVGIRFFKNGSEYDALTHYENVANVTRQPEYSTIVQMNGTTDYLDTRAGSGTGSFSFNGIFWAIGMCEI